MQCGALDGACLGHQQRAAREVERRQAQLPGHGRARWAPAQTPGDHQVQDEEQVVVDADDDPFAEAFHGLHRAPLGGLERGRDGPQHERAEQPGPLDSLPDDARREAGHVHLDVRQLQHARSV